MKLVREWKKVFESDLAAIALEMKDSIEVPAVLILTGEIGMGKTTFTKSFIKSEEDGPTVQSPTYSIINEIGNYVHADFYRLNNAEDITHLELPLYLDSKEFFLIEWGKPYLDEIKKFVDEDFFYYELIITSNEAREDGTESRNYELFKIEDI